MTLLELLSSVSGFTKVRFLADKAVIDNAAFRFHYKVTSAIFFIACILCTAHSFIGDPIECVTTSAEPGLKKIFDIYCWISSTFTFPHHLHNKDAAHPGLGHGTLSSKRTYQSYYQWVPFVLFFQGVLFYMPHWIWKCWEQGKMKTVTDGIRGVDISSRSQKKEKHFKAVQYLIESLNTHNGYTIRYMICEILNFINVIGNLFLINKFLGGVFLTYGIKVLEFNYMEQQNRTDPIIEIFPRVTSCWFYKGGDGGSLEKKDGICVMAINVLNEKIYIFLWFYLIALAVLSGLAVLYRLANVIHSGTKKFVMRKIFHVNFNDSINRLFNKLSFGDFFLLHLLGQNVDEFTFKEIVNDMSELIHDYKGQPSCAKPQYSSVKPSVIDMNHISNVE